MLKEKSNFPADAGFPRGQASVADVLGQDKVDNLL
jgi:hypothetical protein